MEKGGAVVERRLHLGDLVQAQPHHLVEARVGGAQLLQAVEDLRGIGGRDRRLRLLR